MFYVPNKLIKILDRDLQQAGIPKADDRGWTVDVHALRHSFGTLLKQGRRAAPYAQAAMRHSKIDLTMNVYTDPKLLDVHGALEKLPSLPLNLGHSVGAGAVARDRENRRKFRPPLGLHRCLHQKLTNVGNSGQLLAGIAQMDDLPGWKTCRRKFKPSQKKKPVVNF